MFAQANFQRQSYVDSLEAYVSIEREGELSAKALSGLYITSTFQQSNAFLLSNTCLIHHWFLALYGINGSELFVYLSNHFHDKSHHIYQVLLLTAYVWYVSAKREPPDKISGFKYAAINVAEYLLQFIIRKEINILYWYHVLTALLVEIAFEVLYIFIKIEYKPPYVTAQEEFNRLKLKNSKEKILFHEVNKCNLFRYKLMKRTVWCKLILSLSSKKKKFESSETINLDTDSYEIAIDTYTSESVCKEKELFVGKIHSCRRLYIQGVGGKVKVTGVGTIKIRIVDDDGITHELLIHNVLYVPESPVNLLSPQRWSEQSNPINGT